MSVEYFQSDVEIDGKIVVYSVPNSTGTLLTYNPTTKTVGTRTNAEIISDLGLNSDLTAYVKKIGDTMSGPLVFNSNSTSILKKDMSIYPGTTGFARDMFQIIDSTGIKDSFGWFGNVTDGVVTLTYGYLGGTAYNTKSALRWTPDGRVGIGLSSTSVPLSGYALHTVGNTYTLGNIDLSGNINSKSGELTLQRYGVTRFVTSGFNTLIAGETGGNIFLRPNGDSATTTQVTINSAGVISTINDGTSTQWNAAYNTLNSVPRQGATGGTISSVRTSDTRNVNSLPSTDLANGIWFDFKSSSVIGLTGANIFSAVITMVPYTDNSGNIGTAFRLAQSADEMYFQNYASAGTWGAFRKMWTDKHFSQANITSWNNTASQLGNYIPLSQKATANGVATLDASVQIPNAQIPQRLLNKVIALGGEGAVDTSFTGLYDRNQLALADKENTVTSIINGAGTFSGGMAAFNNTIFNSKSDFATLTGTDATTEVVITITFSSVLSNYGRGYWQPFIQSRLQNSQMFRDISVEVMDNNNVWFPALTATNIVNIPGSGLYLFPESSFGTASIKSIRFKLSNALTFNGVVYVSNIGFRHNAHSFAPQFPHRGENNTFFGVNTFGVSPFVPAGTQNSHAVNFGQLSNYLPLSGGQLTGALTIKPSNSGSVFEQDVITFHDLGTGPSNIIPLAFKYGISTTSTAFIKAVSKGLNGVDGALFQFFDNSTKHTEISSVGVTSNSFIKTGGFSTQFLKADGSVDSNIYVTQSGLVTILGNYATLNGVQTFTNTITFNQSPIVPNATLLPHAVNLGQMSNALEESEGNIISYVSGNFQTVDTAQSVGATKSYTSPFPFKFKTAGTKTWVLHKPNGNSLIFAPSTVVDSEDWDWTNQVSFNDDSTIEANKFKVRGGTASHFQKGDGSLDTNDYVTTNTSQSIFGYKTIEPGAELLLKGDDQNLVQSLKTSNQFGGNIVAGWYYRHYSAIWKTGCIRNASSGSEGFGFDLSTDGGTSFNRIFKIQHDGNLVTNNFGSADAWNSIALNGVRKNQVFSTDSQKGLMISDSAIGNEAGLIDAGNEIMIAGEENGLLKFASNIGGIGGLVVDNNTRRMGYGGASPSGSYQHNFGGGKVFTTDSITSAGGFIHNDYNDPNKVLTSDGGTVDITAFGGTPVRYIEINTGDSFTPSADYIHWNVFSKGGMKIYLDSGTGSVNGQVITLHHNTGSITEIWRDGSNVGTISGAKTTRFIKTSLGWQMTDLGPSNFI